MVASSHHVGWDCKGRGGEMVGAEGFLQLWGGGAHFCMGFMLGGSLSCGVMSMCV